VNMSLDVSLGSGDEPAGSSRQHAGPATNRTLYDTTHVSIAYAHQYGVLQAGFVYGTA
jgi:hypothetical protein